MFYCAATSVRREKKTTEQHFMVRSNTSKTHGTTSTDQKVGGSNPSKRANKILALFRSTIATVISSPSEIPQETRICFLIGSTYAPRFESGKIEVSHVVDFTVTLTRTEPNPRRVEMVKASISSEMSFGSVTKCHAPVLDCRQSSDWNSYLIGANGMSCNHSSSQRLGTMTSLKLETDLDAVACRRRA